LFSFLVDKKSVLCYIVNYKILKKGGYKIMELNEIIENLDFSSILWQILTPIIFSLSDVLTGFIQAVINNNLDSKIMRQGLLHKVLIILLVILSFVVDKTFNLPIVSKIVCIYIIVMETISIFENLTKAGLNFGKLTDLLKIKGKEEK
jgi:toxin secretion/phage lysis holin